jgi:uncharacterized protein YdgA (DUF945 family)
MPTGAPKVGNMGFELTLKNRITHGPICGLKCFGIANIDTTVELPPLAQAILNKTYGDEPWLSLRTRLDFLGGGSTDISSPPVADAKTGPMHFSSEGLTATARVSGHANEVDVEGSFPRVVFSNNNGGRFDLQALTFKSTARQVMPELYATDFDIGIDRFDVAGAKPNSTVTIQKLSYGAKSPVSGGFEDTILKFDSGDITGPAVNFKAIHVDLTLRHLKLEALRALNKASQDYNLHLQGASQADRQEMLVKLKDPILALLAAGAQINLDQIGFETQGGNALVSGTLHFSNITDADFTGENPWKNAFAKADADLQVSIDDGAVAALPGQGAAEQLQKYADQGVLTHANGKWSTTLHLAGGNFTANGKPVAPPSTAPAPAPAVR